MSKRIMIGLFALSVVAVLRTEAIAGCADFAGFQICADWITGGSASSVLAVEGPAGTPDTTTPACAVTPGGPPSEALAAALATPVFRPGVDLKLVGTKPNATSPTCGFGATEQSCDIEGVVFCVPPSTVAIARRDDEDDVDHPRGQPATTRGPLTVRAEGFSQTDPNARLGAGRSFAAFRFQVDPFEQDKLCSPSTTGGFQTFVPRKGLFEACVTSPPTTTGGTTTTRCLRESCSVKVGGPNDVHVYGCHRIP